MQRLSNLYHVICFRIGRDLCFLRAAALTYTSSLSVVPIFAVMFGIAKGFGLERILEGAIRREFHDQQDIVQYLIRFSYSLLENTRGGLIAGIGVIFLFYAVLKLLSMIESSLNAMWGVKKDRNFGRKIIDFLALIVLCPIIFVISSSLTVFLGSSLEMMKQAHLFDGIRPMALFALSFAPYVMSSLLFAFLYMYMPNSKVKLRSAIIAGGCAGIAFQFLQAWYIFLQISLTRYGAVYGSFAALPLFLMWLYFSWIIFLLGAEIVVIHQERLWDPEIFAPNKFLNHFERRLAALTLTKRVLESYHEGKILNATQLAACVNLPIRLVIELAQELSVAQILAKVDEGFIPLKSYDEMRVFDVIAALDGKYDMKGKGSIPYIHAFETLLLDQRQLQKHSENNRLIKDI